MRKIIFIVLFTFVALLFVFKSSAQEPRYATCDLCGYCLGATPPANWKSCQACLYPGISSTNPEDNETLKIVDEENNLQPTPFPGRHYTIIGCLSTDLAGGFTTEGAAASPIQTLLNILFSAAGVIAFLYLIYGAFIVLTSRADPEKLNYGKRLILGAVVGLMFTLSAILLVNLIGSQILKIPGFDQ